MEWMVIWGVTQAAGFIFKPILEDLAKDAAKDYAKDFFKDCLKKVIHLPEKDEQKEAYGKALKEFLQFFQQELDDADYQEVQIKQFLEPLKKFIEKPEVAAILGSAFEVDCVSLDTHFLARTWQALNSPFLPDEFSWERVSKRYLKKVKAIIQESEKLRPIFAVQTQSQMAENVQELVGIAPDFDLGRYAEGLREQYGNLKLESLDTTGVYYNELKLWKIFIPQNVRECQEFLPKVYEVPKDHIKRLREAGEDIEILSAEELERQRHRYINQQSQLVWQIIGDPTATKQINPIQQVVILGDPGAGKSSLLQYIALIWAERPLRDLSLYPIPLLLELRIYARDKQAGKCQDILSFIHGGNITCRLNQQQLHEKLRSGQAIALFDGIDEIFDPVLREEVVTDIHRFSNDYAQVQVIVTSRWLGYKAQRLRDAGFRHFMLQDLEIKQIEDFLERWHNLTFTDEVDKLRKKERLIKAIQDSKAIRELAGNPLLLTMMAILNRNQELPRDRPELYNQASRVLLHQWDVERALIEDARLDPKTIDYRDKQAMLRKVAYWMQSSEKGLVGNLISATDLEAVLTDYLKTIEVEQARTVARLFINQLRTRNFILCFLGADSYGFVHRTFLEYFCAWEFVWQFKESQTLTIEQLINDVFGKHWQDESWHEVLRLICGMIEPKFVAEIIDFLLEQKVDRSQFLNQTSSNLKKEGINNIILAVNCFEEVRNKNLISSTSEKLLQTLKNEIEQEFPYRFMPNTAFSLILLIANNWKDEQETLPWLKHCLKLDLSSFVPAAAVKGIAGVWKDSPDTLPWLKELALVKQEDQNDDVQKIAVQSIVKHWLNHSETLSWLEEFALINENSSVRNEALITLAKELKKNSNTLSMLKIYALQDNSWFVRYTALEALVNDWKNDPNTLQFLRKPIVEDNHENVRFQALQILGKNWKEEPDTLEFLKDRYLNDKSEFVRYVAVRTIIRCWEKDPQLFEFLCKITLNYSFKRVYRLQDNPRQLALEALLKNFGDNPKTLEILNQVALNDSDEELRKFAFQKLQDIKKPNP